MPEKSINKYTLLSFNFLILFILIFICIKILYNYIPISYQLGIIRVIISFIVLLFLGITVAILAIILNIQGLEEIKNNQLKGKNLAIICLIIGILEFLTIITFIIKMG